MRQNMLRIATGFLLVFVADTACHRPGVDRPEPVSQRWQDFHPRYPSMLRAANVGGQVVFEVRTDSTGHPVVSTLVVHYSTNDLFTSTVRKALDAAQAPVLQVMRDTVIFRVFRGAGDSVEACAPAGGATVVCGRQPELTRSVLY